MSDIIYAGYLGKKFKDSKKNYCGDPNKFEYSR